MTDWIRGASDWTPRPAPLPSPEVWRWGQSLLSPNQGLVFLVTTSCPEAALTAPPPHTHNRSHLLTHKRYSYHSGDWKCFRSWMPDLGGKKTRHLFFITIQGFFWLVKSKLVPLRDHHPWGILKSPTKAAMWLEGHAPETGPQKYKSKAKVFL